MDSQKKALRLTNYFVSLPSSRSTVLLIIICSVLFGLLASFLVQPVPDFYLALNAIGAGIFALAIPAFLSTLAIFLAHRRLLLRRVLFLSFVGLLVYAAFYLAGVWLANKDTALSSDIVVVGFGIVFGIWFVTSKFLFNLRRWSLVFATVQLLFNAVFFMAANGIALSGDGLSILVKFYFASLVFLGGIYAYFYLINAPMKRNLGISGVDAIALFFSQWFYGERGLEDKLEDLGVEVEVPVAVASFEGKSGKALFVVPYVHFGPFGNLGGSEFCPRLSAALGGKWGNVFVFHGTVTHDFNPVSSDEFEPLLAAVKKAASSLEQKPAKASMAIARKGSAKIQLFSINGCAFASASRAPLTTEDLDFGIGLVLKEKALSSHEIAIVVDEHNAETGDITTVGPASPIANELFGAMDAALAKGGEKLPLHAGFASGSAHLKSIGGNGLRVACFLMGKELHAYLLFDANGIVPDFRDELIAKVKRRAAELGYAAHPEIFTTDTHQVNNVRGVLNPVGKDDRAVLSELSLRLFAEAAGRLEPVKFAAAEERYRTMVFGPTNSIEIISTINSIVAFSKIAAPVMLLAATGLVLWLLTKF